MTVLFECSIRYPDEVERYIYAFCRALIYIVNRHDVGAYMVSIIFKSDHPCFTCFVGSWSCHTTTWSDSDLGGKKENMGRSSNLVMNHIKPLGR